MNKEQIEDIIKSLENSGYKVEYNRRTDNSVLFQCNKHIFSINYRGPEPVVDVGICLGVYSTFNQDNVDWLNSITSYWEIYRNCVCFSFTAKSGQELEDTLLRCVKGF